jgi:hypothetical protein
MRNVHGIFLFVDLNDAVQLAFFYALSICLKGNINDGLTGEHCLAGEH